MGKNWILMARKWKNLVGVKTKSVCLTGKKCKGSKRFDKKTCWGRCKSNDLELKDWKIEKSQ